MPANLVMLRVGYRGWLAGLVAGWGVVASCFALVRQAWSLFLLRLLLGILEAGALPALWHVFAVFYPASRCAGLAPLTHTAAHARARPCLVPCFATLSYRTYGAPARGLRPARSGQLAAAPIFTPPPPPSITVPFSLLSTSILLANMVASPLATGLLAMDTIGGLKWVPRRGRAPARPPLAAAELAAPRASCRAASAPLTATLLLSVAPTHQH